MINRLSLNGYQPVYDYQACPWGETFACRVARWWSGLEWGEGPEMSLLEAYFNFAVTTKSMMPVRIGKGNGYWVLRDQSVEADIKPLDLNIQSAAWIRLMTW